MNARLKEVRKSEKVNLSQREFGRRLGVQDTAISKLESGERNLTDQMILAICREFNVNEEWLRTGEGGEDAMFEESNDSIIEKIIAEIPLDKLSKVILRTYVDMDAKKRAALNEFIHEMSDRVMNGSMEKARHGISEIIRNSHATNDVKQDLSGKAACVFLDANPYIGIGNVDESEMSSVNLDEMRDTVVIAAMGDGLKVVDKEKAKRDLYTDK